MQNRKTRNSSPDVPKRGSPRTARQLKVTGLEAESSSSLIPVCRTPKDKKIQKASEHRSPRSPASEKKRPSRILEIQVAQLQEELKKAKDQVVYSETQKKQVDEDVQDSLKLEKSLKVYEAHHSESKATWDQISVDEAAILRSVTEELQQLKAQIEMLASSEAGQVYQAELANSDILVLSDNLGETLSLVENFRNQLKDCEVSEAETKGLAGETLKQLENAKKTVEAIRSDGSEAIETNKKMALELEQSKSRVILLEELVNKLQANLVHVSKNETTQKLEVSPEIEESGELNAELLELRSEVDRLRSALEAADEKCKEKKVEISSQFGRESKLESQLEKVQSEMEELKANLMEKETELQFISEENESLYMKLEKNKQQSENEIKKLSNIIEDMNLNLMEKETRLQNTSEENEVLKSELHKKEMEGRDAVVKLGLAMEEAEKSKNRAARVVEQLEAVQDSNLEMETELRKLKVQSDQWRKAAEAAAAMLSAGDDWNLGDKKYSPACGKMDTMYCEDMDDEFVKKKEGNVLRKIGVFWKKQPK